MLTDEKMKEIISFGEKIGSYFDAIMHYFQNDWIDEDDFKYIQNTSLMVLLEKELVKKHVLKKENKTMLFIKKIKEELEKEIRNEGEKNE